MKNYSKYVKTERRVSNLSTVIGTTGIGPHLRMYQYLPNAHAASLCGKEFDASMPCLSLASIE